MDTGYVLAVIVGIGLCMVVYFLYKLEKSLPKEEKPDDGWW